MIPDPNEAADAVILVDDAGTVTLFIGDDPEPRAEAATNSEVIRILMDHSASTERSLTVATRYPSGHRTLHRVEPDGTVSARKAVPERAAAVAAAPAAAVAAGSAPTTTPIAPVADIQPAATTASTSAVPSALRPSAIVGTAAVLALVLALTSSGVASAPTNDQSGGYAMGADGGGADLSGYSPPPDPSSPPGTAPPATSAPTPEPTGSSTPEPSDSPTPPGDEPSERPSEEPPGDDTSGDDPSDPPEPPKTNEPPVPPTRPGSLGVADRSGSSLTVSWDSSTAELGVTGYAVYVDGSRSDTVSGTNTTVSGLRSAASYVIEVAAIDGGGNVSSPASLTATTLDIEAPTKPADLAIAGRDGDSLTVSWSSSADNAGVAGYAVYVDGQRADTVSGTTATVGGLTSATSYDVSVAALDDAGNMSGQASTQGKTVDTVAPATPGNLTGRSSITAVTLDWSRSTDNVGVTGYAVYINGRQAMTTTGTTATIENLDGATTYTFSVIAYDAAGNSSKRANIEVRTKAGG